MRAILLGAGAVLLPLAAQAHPHVFAEARLDVVVTNGAVTALRHLWRFDDVFSSTVLMEFDRNADLQLDQAELDEVGSTVAASLAEFGYFQLVSAGGVDVEMSPPPVMMANYEGDQLVILFESAPKAPVKLQGKIGFGVYDPTFYTAIDFAEDDQMAVENLPAECTRTVIRPDPDEVLAQNQATLTEEFFNDPTGNDMSKLFATRLEIDCRTR
jgi:ABC-type uncharacterized transport system substrate-binding protein